MSNILIKCYYYASASSKAFFRNKNISEFVQNAIISVLFIFSNNRIGAFGGLICLIIFWRNFVICGSFGLNVCKSFKFKKVLSIVHWSLEKGVLVGKLLCSSCTRLEFISPLANRISSKFILFGDHILFS